MSEILDLKVQYSGLLSSGERQLSMEQYLFIGADLV